MAKIFNLGSINIDHVYRVPHMPSPGETLATTGYDKYLGGKGVNQSVAASLGGGEVFHIGSVGADGDWALNQVSDLAASINLNIHTSETASGHAIISVDDTGENQILIHGGANQDIFAEFVESVLDRHAIEGDWFITQNETSSVSEAITMAKSKGLKIAYSAAPFDKDAALPLLPEIDILAVNETEARQLAKALNVPVAELPVNAVLMTKGSEGAIFQTSNNIISQQAFKVTPVDTTGAGDTFLGSFIARLSLGDIPEIALEYASAAAALQVTKPGAAGAIPLQSDVTTFINTQKAT